MAKKQPSPSTPETRLDAARKGFNEGHVTAGELAQEAAIAGKNFGARTQVGTHVTVLGHDRTATREAPTPEPARPQQAEPYQVPNEHVIPDQNGERHVVSGSHESETPIPFEFHNYGGMNTGGVTNNHFYWGGGGGPGGGRGGGHSQHSDYHLLHPELNHPLTRSMKQGSNLGNAVVNLSTSGAEAHQLRQLGTLRRTN